MKKILTLNLLCLLLIVYSQTVQADDIWNVDFSTSINKGYWGTNSDMLDVSDWSLDVSACNLENDNDYVKVVGTSGGRLEAVDCNGEAIWKSRNIDISKFSDCNINIDIGETGSSGNANKFVKLFYQLDGGAEYPFEVNAENVGNWNKAQATHSGLNGNSLVIIARINNPLSSNKVYIDNVLVSGTVRPIKRDNLSQVLPSNSPVESISIKATINSEEKAVKVFNFILDETNGANDNLPTKIKRMVFYNQNPSASIIWEKNIRGIFLYDGETKIFPTKIIIGGDSICMDFSEGLLDILNGSKRELSLKCYLDSTETIIDQSVFQLYIKEYNKGFECYESGSGMNRGAGGGFFSSLHKIDVQATKLLFSELKLPVYRGNDFSMGVIATDSHGNIDVDADKEVNIEMVSGDESKWLITSRSTQMRQGIANFSGMQYLGIGTIAFKVKAISLSDSPLVAIVVQNTRGTDVLNVDWDLDQNKISSMRIDSSSAIEIFKFKVRDGGDDGLPTLLNQINLLAGENNQIDWEKSVGGFILKRDDKTIGRNYLWDKNSLTIEFNALKIESEQEATFTLSMYLKEGKTEDESQFQIGIDSVHEGWVVDLSGSDLKERFSDNLNGPVFECDVEATKMEFTSLPRHAPLGQTFSVEVSLLDEFGNVDINSMREISLSLESGGGELESLSGLTRTASKGSIKWDDLTYSKAENFTMLAESPELNSILSDNISAVDQNSKILSGESISRLNIPASAIDKDNAISILNFTIQDVGNNDELPTEITSAKFFNYDVDNGICWEKHIAGAVLKKGEQIVAHTTNVTDTYIQFYSSSGILEVENGSNESYNLSIYFKPGQIPDNTKLQVYIPKEKHAWKSKDSGSGIEAMLSEDILSEIYNVNVVADRILFGKQPYLIKDSSDTFSLNLFAADSCSNVDTDFKKSVHVKLITENGDLSINNPVIFIDGEKNIQEIEYNGIDDLKMSVEFENQIDTGLVYLGEDLLSINEDFESLELSNWMNTADWTISSYNKIEGRYSLKHNLSKREGSSYITKLLENWRPDCGAIRWEFVLQSGDWDPNGDNNFQFHLVSNNDNPNEASLVYSVGINHRGADDFITLSKLDDGEYAVLLKSKFNWDKNETVAISVSYTSDGKWTLATNRLGIVDYWTRWGEVTDSIVDVSNSWFSCLQFNYGTASRAGDLWLDNLKINAIAQPPKLKEIDIKDEKQIALEFNKPLNFEKCMSISKFELLLENRKVEIAEFLNGDKENSIDLVLSNNLESGIYSLKIEDIFDKDNKVLKTDTCEFIYLAPAKPFDIVFNELMVDESPVVGLPEYEFIELYNRSSHPICIDGWKLKVGDKDGLLKNDTIKAKSYLILCSTTAVDSLISFGKVLGVTNFPALNNSGNTIELHSQEGVIVDQLTYSEEWYQSDEKSKGGWTLERIDPYNISWQEPNWTSSVDQSGGTPGKENSVRKTNQDQIHPQLIDWLLLSDTEIKLSFSEPLNIDAIINPDNYRLNELQQNPVAINFINSKEVVLSFSNSFIGNQEYTLLLSESLIDLAGNDIDVKELKFVVPVVAQKGDVVINEIMFNPYPRGSDYVEIYNVSDSYIDLTQLFLANMDEKYQINETYLIGEKQRLLHPKQYLLVSEDTAFVVMQYPTNNETAFLQLKKLPSYQDESGRVVLLRSDNYKLDDFAYSAQMHSDLLSNVEGVALERVNPKLETNRTSNWQSAAQSIGFGTPGLQNSVFKNESITESEVNLSRKRFTPNNDGKDDRLLINFNLKETGQWVNIRIFNSIGKEIRKLASNISVAQKDQLYWDGLGTNKKRLPIGIYVVYIELFSEKGTVKTYKKTCVLGGKYN